MAVGAASGTNVFVPSFQATGGLVIDYARDPGGFAVNRYSQTKKVENVIGYYLKIDPDENARVQYADARNFLWPDGQDAPSRIESNKLFQFVTYECQRYLYGFTLGYLARQQAVWNIEASHAAAEAQRAMTVRAELALAALSGASWGSNTADVDGGLLTAGQNWGNGTATAPYIKNSLLQAAITIHKATVGVVRPSDLVLLIDPDGARKMAISPEVHAYLKESPAAMATLMDSNNWNMQWGLPPTLYGFPIVVEDTVVETTKKGAAALSKRYPLNSAATTGTAYFLSRKGGLDGGAGEGTEAFSTLTGFFKEEMTVESRDDPDNRVVKGRVVEHYQYQVTSHLSGFKFTKTFG